MFYEGDDFLSIHDFVEIMCKSDKKESASALMNEFCTLVTSKYSYNGNKCFKAEAADKTRHVLFTTDLVLDIFLSENIRRFIITDSFMKMLNEISRKNYSIISGICCCCPKKLKKSIAGATAFTEFVKRGDVEIRRFNSLKHNIRYLVCLDIEAHEIAPNKLLEFGLSIFDMQTKTTSNTHIIVSDHLHLQNGRFVANNRAYYNFGKSILMSLNKAVEHVIASLSVPNSCLIGHNINADINFLRSVSTKKLDLPIFDTQIIYKQATLSEDILGLVRVLDKIGIPHSNLHNAGNDAYYTLEVFKLFAKL